LCVSAYLYNGFRSKNITPIFLVLQRNRTNRDEGEGEKEGEGEGEGERVHEIIEAKKSHNMSPIIWKTCKASGITGCKFEDPKSRSSDVKGRIKMVQLKQRELTLSPPFCSIGGITGLHGAHQHW
jgi:hypothetical protein